jgi:Spy/CpxP family protein refolding chaperone
MKNIRLWLVLLLVFTAGVAAGTVVTRAVTRKAIQQAVADPNRVREAVARRMFSRLDLKPEQRQEVGAVLKDTQVELRQLRTSFVPRYLEVMSNAEHRISARLTPEQRERFLEFRNENRQLWMPR